ncbi:MAG: GAF domain-containing SpoIIE family protein phosphatase, partial [Gemmataceae bacterium]
MSVALTPPALSNVELASPDAPDDQEAYQRLLRAARELVDRIHEREEEVSRLLRVTENINRGLGLEEVLEFLYQELRPIIPFCRIGCALLDEPRRLVVAHWARSDRPISLGKGFRAPLAGSTLEDVVRTGRPRIINDLVAYLRDKPSSDSTRLMVREGMRSSLTCPLVVQGRPVGFLFFSSDQAAAYSHVHVEFFQQIASQLSVIIEKGRLYSELAEQAALIEKQNRQLLQQLEMARQLQRAMIPSEALRLPDMALAFAYRPAQQVGGDILDIVPLPERRALVFVGDAMGHGVEAALVMAAAKTALHTAVRSSADPADVLRQINDGLYAMVRGESFMTAVCARLDPAGGRAELALAGHPNPFHIDAATGEVSRPGDAGVPLGFRAGQVFPALSCPFGSGDKLVFFTDGVLEAKGVDGRHYGEERFPALVHDHADSGAEELLRAIERDLERHCQTISHDDLTVLAV